MLAGLQGQQAFHGADKNLEAQHPHAQQVEQVAVAVHQHVVHYFLHVDRHRQPQHRINGRAHQRLRHHGAVGPHELPEPAQHRFLVVAGLKRRIRQQQQQHAGPLLLKLGQLHPVQPAIAGVHVRNVLALDAVNNHVVVQLLLDHDVGNGGQRNLGQALGRALHALGLKAELGSRLHHAQHIGATLVGGGVLPDAGHRQQLMVDRHRGQASRPAVGNVPLLHLANVAHRVSFPAIKVT